MTTNVTLAQIPTASIRPTRWVVFARLIIGVLLLVIAVSGWILDIRFLPVALVVLGLIGIASSARDMVACLKVGPEGIAFRTHRLAWDDIFQFTVVDRPWSRRAEVEVATAGGVVRRRLPAPATSQLIPDPGFDRDVSRLRTWVAGKDQAAAAPTRTGFGGRVSGWAMVAVFIVVLMIFDRPLGWLGGAQAATVPSACAVLTPAQAAEIGATTGQESSASTVADVCTWNTATGSLSITYQRYVRYGLHSGTDQAQYNVTLQRRGITGPSGTAQNIQARPESRFIAGIPAPVLVYPSGAGLQVLTHRGNILIDVQLDASSLDAMAEHTLTVATNAAIANVDLH